MNPDREEVINTLRATLLSYKGPLSLKQCNNDYMQMEGRPIPYEKLGYSSLRKLLESHTGFRLSDGHNGECMITVIPSQNTKNLALLVSKQKQPKKSAKNFQLSQPRKVSQNAWKPGLMSNMWKYINPPTTKTHSGYHKPQSTSPKKNVKFSPEPPKYNSNNTQPKINDSKPENGTNKSPNQKIYNQYNVNTKSEVPKAPVVHMSAADRLNALQTRLQQEKIEPVMTPKIDTLNREISKLTIDKDMKDNKARLWKLCKLMNLPEPVLKVHETKAKKKGPSCFDCILKIGTEHTFNTYPNSLSSHDLAVETVSSKALAHLQKIAMERGSGKTCTPTSVALDRIAKIVASHTYGLFVNRLPDIYRQKYPNENLPDDWLKSVKSSPLIQVEEAMNGISILIYSNDNKSIPSSPPYAPSVSVEEALLPPPLQYPEESSWNVFVMSANSTIEIWLRIVGEQYSDAFEALNTDMELYYHGHTTPSNNILIGGWYALKWEDGWLRTRILEIDLQNQTALCFLVDTGDEESHSLKNFFDLPTQFLNLAPQAILCRLGGLEEFSLAGSSSKFDFSEILVSKVLVAEILQVPDENQSDDPSVTVVLYDTSTKRDINLNQQILLQLTNEVKPPKLSHGINEIFICDIKPSGEIYAQIHNESWHLFQQMLNQVVNGPFPKEALQASSGPLAIMSKFYLVKSNSGDWLRAVLENKQILSNGEEVVTANYIDSGVSEVVLVKDVILLERLSTTLDLFPVQLLKLSLYNVPRLRDEQFKFLNNLLPRNTLVLCKEMSPGSNVVEIFVRTQPHNILCSVNNAINMEIELAKNDSNKTSYSDAMSALTEKKGRIFSSIPKTMSQKEIPKFELPKKGEMFSVYVAMAANPSNFTVQSIDAQTELQEMLEKLQSVANKPPLSVVPVVGGAYAAYYDKDDYWYRVIVQGMISNNMASIYFCDYGNLQSVQINQLKELPNELKTLPAQAIKAKLHGVSPVNLDWSVEDCLRFKEIVEERSFISIVENIEQDPIQRNEPLLSLTLIDTSTENDVYIHKILANEKIAKLK